MSHEEAKKRKRGGQQDGAASIAEGGTAVAAPDPMMAEMRAMLEQNCLQTAQMQDEMAGMKMRLSRIDGLENKCQYLEARCGSLERTVQSLTKNFKWENCYSAPPIPSSHWAGLGFDDDYIECMELFLKDIKKEACDLRSGEYCRDIDLCGNYDGEGNIILHDDILLPHWREFADALQLYHHSMASNIFSLSNIILPSVVLDVLTAALQGKMFFDFYLDNNGFVNIRDGIEFAIKFTQQNPNLIKFTWMNNPMNTIENVNRLIEAVNSLPSLEHIGLVGCCRDPVNGYSILCSLLTHNENCKLIDLDSNNIRTLGGTHLPDYLATNPPLEKLFLRDNHLNDKDAKWIADALKLNSNLRQLRLGENEITDVGKNALRNAINDSTSLNSVADSNHTCRIPDLQFSDVDENESNSARNRGAKIYALLCSRNREGANVCHLDLEFGDDALKLTPKLLECVPHYSQYSGNDKTLSIMYEILRSWRIPELYESYMNQPLP